MKKVAVIGAGLAGLAAGIYACLNGCEVEVIDFADRPGGICATWRRNGYSIHGDVHFLAGFRSGPVLDGLYRDLGIYQPDRFAPLNTFARFADPAAGLTLDLPRDSRRVRDDLKAISPNDGPFIDYFLDGAEAFSRFNLADMIPNPPELTGWREQIQAMVGLKSVAKHYFGRALTPVEQAVKSLENRFLQGLFRHIFIPDAPLSLAMMTLGLFFGGQLWLRRDGSEGLVGAMVKRLEKLGGRIRYKTRVEKILVEHGAAKGLVTSEKEHIPADWVVSTADGYSTIFNLLGGRFASPKIKAVYRDWPLFRPALMIHYGLARDMGDAPWRVVVNSGQPMPYGYAVRRWWPVCLLNYSPETSPEGKSLVQVIIDSEWDAWRKLRDNRHAYEAEKRSVAAAVLERLEPVWPGISGQVKMTDVATPYTWWQHTLNRKGALHGFAVTAKSMTTRLPRTLPGLRRFVMAGQWVSPGGRVIPTLMSGRQAVMIACRQERRPFRSEV